MIAVPPDVQNRFQWFSIYYEMVQGKNDFTDQQKKELVSKGKMAVYPGSTVRKKTRKTLQKQRGVNSSETGVQGGKTRYWTGGKGFEQNLRY